MVDIYYDLYDGDGDEMTVSLEVSDDAGQTYDLAATLLTGDIGEGITSGTGKHVVWDFGTEHPDYFSDQIKLKIIADDGVSEGGGEPCPGIPTITYAGKTYNTVQIGEQCWLRENLDVGTMIESNSSGFLQTDNGVLEKYCYDNDPANCETYGGFYEWPEAMQYVTTEGAQGICPDGWHIPTTLEYSDLINIVNNSGNKLKEIGQGDGNNESGWSALLAGLRSRAGNFYDMGMRTGFHISKSVDGSRAYTFILSLNDTDNYIVFNFKERGYSVRCIKD